MSEQYHKIQTVFKRTGKGELIVGEYSMPEFEWLKDCGWLWTEKVDGTNIRVMWDGTNVVFGGKTDNSQTPTFLIYRLQELFEGHQNEERLRAVFNYDEPNVNVCLYGEGYGAKIQKGGGNYKSDGVDFVLFDVKVEQWWLKREDVEDVAERLGIKTVPIVGRGSLPAAIEKAQTGFNSEWGDFPAEGLVLRPGVQLFNRMGQRVITKIKHKDFNRVSHIFKETQSEQD